MAPKEPKAEKQENPPEPEVNIEPEQSQTEVNKIETLLTMAGLSLTDVAAALKPLIVESTAELLNGMKIDAVIERTVEAKTIALGAEVKAILARMEANQQQGSGVPVAQAGAGISDTLMAALIQKIIGGGSGNSMSAMTDMFKGMSAFMGLTAELYQKPRLGAQKEFIDILKAGLSLDMDPKQVLAGADKIVSKGLEDLAKPTT